jgi:Family of unknown function (DUF5317)
MLIALILATGAVALGLAREGSLEALAATPLRGVWLLFCGLGLQLTASLWSPAWLTGPWALLVIVLSNLAIVVFIAVNRLLPGMLLADLGVALNLLVIVANGAMPVAAGAARVAGIETTPGALALRHQEMTAETSLPWLGDIIPMPGLREVLSVGDLLLAAGIAVLVYARTTAVAESGDGGASPGRGVRSRGASGSPPAARPAPRP